MNKIIEKISIPLAVVLLMFPQIVETMYSPALTSVKNHFGVSSSEAAQAMSIFFIAFAFGVVFWGRMCDVLGRRISTLLGLAVFITAAIFTMLSPTFDLLLIGFGCCAFGAAVGSVCTQTIIRDGYQGKELSHVFSIVGTSIGISPVVGMLTGSWLTSTGGYKWVFCAMVVFVAALLIWSLFKLPETKPVNTKRDSLISVAMKMLTDPHIWYVTLMVGLFNIALFSYYSIAPFMFEKLGASVSFFGNTGFILAIGSVLGSVINMKLIRMHLSHDKIVTFASWVLLIAGLGVFIMQDSVWFFIPMVFVSLSFGLALPNLLSGALTHYRDHLGSAGALLGLFYYLIIGFGLHKAAEFGDLAVTLLGCAIASIVLVIMHTLHNVKRR
ncbi:multidrug effflux MFS transporter [Vibrio lentus]|uniref:multidrug effflux MFS transporter n=1 Tax=Vibrio TaxID=662 RepID=UPI0002E90AB7|nr:MULTISPECIES: multidrug effflux MFS transporter [Vibrio]OCH67347.1 MFS transporter [Vibrio lentus]PMH91839.1 MFS transporter [Vibrio lentus]PMI03142.1 MFS transporter [Vibrio lentus]PMI55730.1 MFS transporter [Vibrio lentus]PMI88628.1 MFS transporter [Vibrio lentus]